MNSAKNSPNLAFYDILFNHHDIQAVKENAQALWLEQSREDLAKAYIEATLISLKNAGLLTVNEADYFSNGVKR